MSITNFTRGPWKLSDDAIRRVIKGGGEKPRTVCIIESWTAESDAALIASAPDLYDALDAFLDAYEEQGEVDFALRQKARAALNRAEGRTP